MMCRGEGVGEVFVSYRICICWCVVCVCGCSYIVMITMMAGLNIRILGSPN